MLVVGFAMLKSTMKQAAISYRKIDTTSPLSNGEICTFGMAMALLLAAFALIFSSSALLVASLALFVVSLVFLTFADFFLEGRYDRRNLFPSSHPRAIEKQKNLRKVWLRIAKKS